MWRTGWRATGEKQGTSVEATEAVQEGDAGGLDSGRETEMEGRNSCFTPCQTNGMGRGKGREASGQLAH